VRSALGAVLVALSFAWTGVLPARAEPALGSAADERVHVLIVGGLGGEPQYARAIESAADRLVEAFGGRPEESAEAASARVVRLVGESATRDALEREFERLRRQSRPRDRVLVFLLGHGSFDGEVYKFNLPGVDVAGEHLVEWLDALPARRQVIVNATSASGALAERLKREGRIVITATRSGGERNATVFGEHWSRALADPGSDLNRDGWVSVAEAFAAASEGVAAHYTKLRRIRTEHAQLAGAAASEVRLVSLRRSQGVNAERSSRFDRGNGFSPGNAVARGNRFDLDRSSDSDAGFDPAQSFDEETEARRRSLTLAIARLRERKDTLDEEAYYRELEALLRPLARIWIERPEAQPQDRGAAGSRESSPSGESGP